MTNTPEFYAREVTLDDVKFAQEGTEVYNSAYNTHGIVRKNCRGAEKKLF